MSIYKKNTRDIWIDDLLFKSETKNIENLTGTFLSLKRTLVFIEIVLN